MLQKKINEQLVNMILAQKFSFLYQSEATSLGKESKTESFGVKHIPCF